MLEACAISHPYPVRRWRPVAPRGGTQDGAPHGRGKKSRDESLYVSRHEIENPAVSRGAWRGRDSVMVSTELVGAAAQAPRWLSFYVTAYA